MTPSSQPAKEKKSYICNYYHHHQKNIALVLNTDCNEKMHLFIMLPVFICV